MAAETLTFQTEQKQLMEIIIHSLYSHKEIFLRELISNACDAVDKARFQGLTDKELLEGDEAWKIKLIADKEAGTLTLSDNGIGMSRESIVQDLGTIARSGTRAFLEQLKENQGGDAVDLIGQFGVGFYASFMVAEEVTVLSRPAGKGTQAVRWVSRGEGTFSVEDAEKEGRGTDVILKLREDEKEFLEEWRLRQVVKKFSDYVEHPVVMDVEREEGEGDEKQTVVKEETLNSRKAIWLRGKDEVTEEEHEEFYRHLSHDFSGKPLRTIHYAAEGTLEFRALLYIPAAKPFDFLMPTEPKSALHLYVQRVQIMADCESLLPAYLRFVKGVVDSSDLPLNVSRELLQENRTLARIRKNLVGKVLGELESMRDDAAEEYAGFFENFGTHLKEGVIQEAGDRDRLARLLRFESINTEAGKTLSLAEYVEAMPEGQEAIHFLCGEDRARLEKSPYLEVFRARGQDVLLMTDPIDDWFVQHLTTFEEKPLKAVDRGELDETDAEKEKREQQGKEYADLLTFLQEQLDGVKEVRLSSRLKESAACLVADEHGMSANMERILRKMGRDEMAAPSERVLEINPDHDAVQALRTVFTEDKADERLKDYALLLHEQALIAEGSAIPDPVGFAARINRLLVEDAHAEDAEE